MMDVVVIGAGAAGLFCASVAAAGGRSVVVLDHNTAAGKKIRISGGGRCNFTNTGTTFRNFRSRNPDFARSALARYTPDDFVALVESYGIAWHEKTLGQLFCDGSAQQIIDMLLAEMRRGGADLRLGTRVRGVRRTDVFHVETDTMTIDAKAVVVATGGLSIPSLGATDLGYRIARHFGVPIVPTVPALVPLLFDDVHAKRFGGLAGVSLPVTVSARGSTFHEGMLFTHRGLSGPSILQISSWIDAGDTVEVDLLPTHTLETLLPQPNRERRDLSTVLSTVLPRRLVQQWPDAELQRRVDQTSKVQLGALMATFKRWNVQPVGTEGYAKAEVTRGGVDTDALSSKTMEVRSVPGLYMIGEVVDMTGWLGGYNFQWAWASAFAAGSDLAARGGDVTHR